MLKRIYIILMMLSLITGCTTDKEKQFEHPLEGFTHIPVYYSNKLIEGKISFLIENGKIKKRDSLVYNKIKNSYERISLSGLWSSKTIWKYDTLNQLVFNEHHSDMSYTFNIKYKYYPDLQLIKQLWYEVSAKPRLDKIEYYYFDNDLRKAIKEISISEPNKDTLSVTYNIFVNDLLTKILIKKRNNFGEMEYNDSVVYKYIGKNRKEDKFYINGILKRTNYYSLNKEIVDSTIDDTGTALYYKHFSK